MIQVCPERDAQCPHAHPCPFALDRYTCKPEGLSRSVMGEEVDLKPCPFCGGSRIGGPYRGNPDTRLHYFACVSTPGVSCASVFGLSPEQARERWNRRPTPAEESSVEAQPSGYSTPIDVGIGAPSPVECQWPAGLMFGFHDEPGEHDPCYVIMPGGAMLPFNHHAEPGVDIARARFVQIACNAMLAGRTEAGWQPRPGAVVHDVKCWPEFFKAIADGRKPWELRNNDRGYQAGDIMRIREWEPGAQSYTGAELWRGVPFVLHGAGDWLPVGKCIMSLADYAPAEARTGQPEGEA